MVHERRASVVLLTESACAVALSVLLGNLRLLELPNGGSIALATLPLLALALSRGVPVGMLAGLSAGVAHALAGGVVVHPVQLLLDYPVAYAALGLAGVSSGRGTDRISLAPGIVLAMGMHLAAMVASGVVFFAPVAGDAALAYSVAYNAATVGPETALALWLAAPLLRAIARANPADAWRRGLLSPPQRVARVPRWYVPTDAPASIDTKGVSRFAAATRDMSATAAEVGALRSFVRPTPFTTASTAWPIGRTEAATASGGHSRDGAPAAGPWGSASSARPDGAQKQGEGRMPKPVAAR